MKTLGLGGCRWELGDVIAVGQKGDFLIVALHGLLRLFHKTPDLQ